MMVADEVYNDKARVDLTDEEPTNAVKPFVAVDVLLARFEVCCR